MGFAVSEEWLVATVVAVTGGVLAVLNARSAWAEGVSARGGFALASALFVLLLGLRLIVVSRGQTDDG